MSPRTAYPGRCRTCRARILRGLDSDLCAFQATADPTPLSPLGEALALLADRQTFHLRQERGNLQLDRRDRWQIQGQPAGTAERLWPFDVVAEHACYSAPLPSIKSLLKTKPTTTKKDPSNVQPSIPPF